MALHKESKFYKEFVDAAIASNLVGEEESDRRIKFISLNYEMIPKAHRELVFNLTRSYPTPPVYNFLVLGVLGTNISRFGATARPGCHTDQWERAGAFYMLIGASRLGKGVAMNLLWKLGSHIQCIRKLDFPKMQLPT